MKFTAKRDGLLAACQAAAAAAADRGVKPVLGCLKAVAAGDAVTVTGFDTEVALRVTVKGVAVERDGAAVLPAEQWVAFLREAADGDVTVDATVTGIKARAGTGRLSLPVLPVEEYPDPPTGLDGGVLIETTAGELRKAVGRVAWATDRRDSTRFALAGVLVEPGKGGFRLVGTDSKRLAVADAAGTVTVRAEPLKGTHHILPRAAAVMVGKALGDDAEPVRVVLRPNEAEVATDRAVVYTRLLEGKYPPHRDVIPKGKPVAAVTLDMPEFGRAVRRAAVACDPDNRRVDLSFGPGQVVMHARGHDTGDSESLTELGDYTGEEVAIGFDPDYLLDVVKAAADAGPVRLEMGGGTKPAVFRAGEDFTVLVMPLGQ